jgi:hypothetical protein
MSATASSRSWKNGLQLHFGQRVDETLRREIPPGAQPLLHRLIQTPSTRPWRNSANGLDPTGLQRLLLLAIEEDLGPGDLTSLATIPRI